MGKLLFFKYLSGVLLVIFIMFCSYSVTVAEQNMLKGLLEQINKLQFGLGSNRAPSNSVVSQGSKVLVSSRLCLGNRRGEAINKYIHEDYYELPKNSLYHNRLEQDRSVTEKKGSHFNYYFISDYESKQLVRMSPSKVADRDGMILLNAVVSIIPDYILKEIRFFTTNSSSDSTSAEAGSASPYDKVDADNKVQDPEHGYYLSIGTNRQMLKDYHYDKKIDLLYLYVHEIGHMVSETISKEDYSVHSKEECNRKYPNNNILMPWVNSEISSKVDGVCRENTNSPIIFFFKAFWEDKKIIFKENCGVGLGTNNPVPLEAEFPRCYSKTNVFEDFADSFTEYVLRDSIKSANSKLQPKLNFFELNSVKLKNSEKPIFYKQIRKDIRDLIAKSEFCKV